MGPGDTCGGDKETDIPPYPRDPEERGEEVTTQSTNKAGPESTAKGPGQEVRVEETILIVENVNTRLFKC